VDTPLITRSAEAQATINLEDFSHRLGQLVERWRKHRDVDLELRLETGALLNQRYGDPTQRQNRGDETLEKAAKQLGIVVSEVSRMRNFAHNFKSLAVLKEKHPEATTWTAVKNLLPSLNPNGKKQGKAGSDGTGKATSKPEERTPVADILSDALIRLSSQLRDSRRDLSEKERERLVVQVHELAKALAECLQISVSVEVPSDATPAADQAGEVSAVPRPSADQAV